MNALVQTRDGLIRALTPAPSINIVPTVLDFGGQSTARLASLARAAGKVADAVHSGQMYAQMLNPADFALLKAFVQFADSEFALVSAGFRRDTKTDEQHSPDGYSHHLDREKL